MSETVGVIGGGLAGLAAACTLAARGRTVTLFERNSWLGGKAAVLEEAGFRFDMGPTILTVPAVIERIFEEAGRNVADYLELVRLDPQWRCFFEDGARLDLHEDEDRMTQAIREMTADEASTAGYRRFLRLARRLTQISERFFFWRSVGSVWDTMDWRRTVGGDVFRDLWTMRLGATVGETVRQHVPDARVAQMMDHFTQYVGSSPSLSPAVLCSIADLQIQQGVWYPMGGTRAVPLALERLAKELGVEFRLGAEVRRIVTENGSACGVELEDGERIHLAAVVSNCDAVLTHRMLLDEKHGGSFLSRRTYEPACSGVVLYLGLDKGYDHLLHHDFVFSRDPEEEFEAIYGRGEPAPDPTCYLAAPARTEAGVAPPAGEALYVLVHTPYLRDRHDWEKLLPDYRRIILDKLKRTAGLEDIESRIVFESRLTPVNIRDRYRSLSGAIYGLASHGRFTGAFKPPNRSPDVRGLYLCGGTSHPGPGMPMVLMSGWIAADSLTSNEGPHGR